MSHFLPKTIVIKDSCNKWQSCLFLFFLHPPPINEVLLRYVFLFTPSLSFSLSSLTVATVTRSPIVVVVVVARYPRTRGHPISHEHVNVYTRTAILCLPSSSTPTTAGVEPAPHLLVKSAPFEKVIYELIAAD